MSFGLGANEDLPAVFAFALVRWAGCAQVLLVVVGPLFCIFSEVAASQVLVLDNLGFSSWRTKAVLAVVAPLGWMRTRI